MKIGTILEDRYELIQKIGKGGTSNVYLAKDKQLNRCWAIKCLCLKQNKDYDDAFKKEVELLSTLDHPDIPRIVQYIETETHAYVVMDYLDGISLDLKLKKEGPQKEEDVIIWTCGLCDILHYLHTSKESPLIHCDLKPRNIILVNNRPKLIDFGIAKISDTQTPNKGLAVGTAGYAPPEQYHNGSNILSPASDVYALGITLYKLLTNVDIDKLSHPCERIQKYNPDVSEGIEKIIYKCIQNESSLRYQSVMEVKEELQKLKTICNEPYKQVVKQLMLTSITFLLVFLFAGISVFGHHLLQAEEINYYQNHYKMANHYKEAGFLNDAKDEYVLAMKHNHNKPQTYQEFYKVLNTLNADKKETIDYFKKNIKPAELIKDPLFALEFIRETMALNETQYHTYTIELLEALNKVKSGNIDHGEVNARLWVLTPNEGVDIYQKKEVIQEFKKRVDGDPQKTPYEKISQYEALLLFYNAYADQLEGASEIIQTIGMTCENIIQSQYGNEAFTFDRIASLYEILSIANQNQAVINNDKRQQDNYLKQAHQWKEKAKQIGIENE